MLFRSGVLYGLIKGYDVSSIFSGGQWILYIVAPMIGAVLGGVFHRVVEALLPEESSEEK